MSSFYKYFLFPFLFLFARPAAIAQNKAIDSLKAELRKATHDTTRSNILYEMIEAETEDSLWIGYNDQLQHLVEANLKKEQPALRSFYLKKLAETFNNNGFFYSQKGDVKKAMEYWAKSMEIQEDINDQLGLANSLHNLGSVYSSQGNISEALKYFNRTLKIREQIGDKTNIPYELNDIAFIYQAQGNIPTALEYFEKNLKMLQEANNKKGVATSYNNIGFVYDKQNNTAKALDFFYKSLKIRESIGDKEGLIASHNNIGGIYKRKGDITKALEHFNQSLNLIEQTGNKYAKGILLCNIGDAYFRMKNYELALDYALRAMQEAKKIGFPENIKSAALLLNNIYKIKKDPKNALENYELYILMRDSVNNAENRKASLRSQLKYEYDKKATADSVKAAQEKKLTTFQLKQEENQRYFLYGGLGLALIFGGVMFNRFRITKKQKMIIEEQKYTVEKQKALVEEKQKEILDSIHYAKRIQQSLLPSEKFFERIFKNKN